MDEDEKQQYYWVINTIADLSDYTTAKFLLKNLMFVLNRYYEQRVILLIDDFDLPLYQAVGKEYYDNMVYFFQSLFGMALKGNEDLAFGLLSGSMRLSQDIPCGGFNNFKILDIDSSWYLDQFGFKEDEVKKLLEDYNLQDHFAEVKEWYDGYRFGDEDFYCPWDVIKYVQQLTDNPDAEPEAYWTNTSGNDLVRRFIDKANFKTRKEIECLIEGQPIEKRIRLDLTYDEIDKSIDNLWSVLYTTGYLTHVGDIKDDVYRLVIPNKEIKKVFESQIQEWFKNKMEADPAKLLSFGTAFTTGDVSTIQSILSDFLWNSISIRDTAVKTDKKENFYHGLLLGLLGYAENDDWDIKSNEEHGEGYSDIAIYAPEGIGVIIEVKYAEDGNLKAACEKALKQIKEKKYAEDLNNQGLQTVLSYGIAFYKKRCMVVKA